MEYEYQIRRMYMKMKVDCKFGFTLAEVLITLGVIGIVAAMTMPTLIQKNQNEVLKNQFKAAYSDLNQAAMMFKVHNDMSVSEYASANGSSKALLAFSKEFKTLLNKQDLNLESLDENGQRIDPYKAYPITGNVKNAPFFCDISGYITDPQGRILSFDDVPAPSVNGPKVCIDINGQKLPNRIGKDIFIFMFTIDGHVIPYSQEHKNNPAVGSMYSNNIVSPLENYCRYTTYPEGQMTCAYFAANDKHPQKAGKDYWNDFINGK